jgi:hypothetical protein
LCRGGCFCYTAENSHHLKAQVTPKNPLFQEEEISVRRMATSSNFGEIIKKLHFLGWWKACQRATHNTPHLSASRYRTFYTCWTASAIRKCEIYSQESLAGEGGVICETVPFVNGSSDRPHTQNKDSQYHSAPLLFGQDLSNSYWWLLASFGEFI